MKRFLSILLIVALAGICLPAFAANEPEEHVSMIPRADNTYDIGSAERGFRRIYVGSSDQYISTFNKTVPLPITTFLESSAGTPLSTTTQPGIEIDNVLPALVWADGETTPVLVTFRVPDDYISGGSFRTMADESDSTTPNQIDFDVYINSDGGTWDSSATGQDPVALTVDGGIPEMVTLEPDTDFDALEAGDIVTLRLWRDNTADGTGDLELYYVEFYYD